jgi:D-alanyl-D-alanine carboxypeptidase
MLGRIIERVTRKPLAQVMRSMLFRPLGMNASSYPTSNSLPKPFLNGYTIQGSMLGNVLDSTNWSPTSAAGAGQAISTVPDLLKWARDVGTGALLKPATQRQRLRPNPASRAGKRVYLFGLGLDNGWLSHQGQIPGYNTEIAYLPALKASIVVIANSDMANGQLLNPAPAIWQALTRVIAPRNVPTGLRPEKT